MNTVAKITCVFTKFLLSIVLGMLVALFFIQNDPAVKRSIAVRLQPLFAQLLKSDISFSVKKITLFPLSIELENMLTRPRTGDDWFWHCSSMTLGCSWIDFLLYGTIALRLDMEHLKAKTILDDNGLCVWHHIEQLFEGDTSIPFFLQSINVSDAHIQIDEPYTDMSLTTDFLLKARSIGNALKASIHFKDASCLVQGVTLARNLKGPVRVDILNQANSSSLIINTNCTVDVEHMGEHKSCHLFGSWKYDHGLFLLKNDDRSFVVEPIKLYLVGKTLVSELSAHFPAAYMQNLFLGDHEYKELVGTYALGMNIDFEGAPSSIQGELTSGKIRCGNIPLTSAGKLSFNRKQNKWHGKLFVEAEGDRSFSGTFKFNESDGAGSLAMRNHTTLTCPGFLYWNVLPHAFSTTMTYTRGGRIDGDYRLVATNEKLSDQYTSTGKITWHDDTLQLDGLVGDNKVCLKGKTGKSPRLLACSCNKADGESLVDINVHDQHSDKLIGHIAFPLVRSLLLYFSDYDLQGEGNIKLQSTIKDKKLFTQFNLVDGHIRLPHTYNFINDFQMRLVVDPFAYLMTIQDMIVSLHRGTINCKRATILFDQSVHPLFAHVPIIFDDCLLNWQKDLFAVVSGQMTLKKEKEKLPLLTGRIFIDRSQLKRNIFSPAFQKSFFMSSGSFFMKPGADLLLDMHVKTKEPVRVKTSFLQTSVKVDLIAGGSIMRPELTGTLSLLSGSLAFPYKPLHITHGSIDFVAGQLDDPMIEISAKNKLKKYNVSLQVSGSLQQQQIILESSPPLKEEQIISLLLAGSHNESLNIVMPALIMQNMKNIIFSADQSTYGVRGAFGRLLKPFKKIHLVPSFTDQTGRGGLRGAIEIDVSERWRAMIQKNFSLTEDTRFEVEYLLSDEVSLRGVRDERGDMSAEVEMRWKR